MLATVLMLYLFLRDSFDPLRDVKNETQQVLQELERVRAAEKMRVSYDTFL